MKQFLPVPFLWRSGLVALVFAAVSIFIGALSACAGASASGGSSGVLMGGTIQGKPMSFIVPNIGPFAGTGNVATTDGTGTAAEFNQPSGITTDGTNLYVAENGGNVIRKIVIATDAVTTLAGDGTQASVDSSDGTGGTASFNQPSGITTDGTNLYVVDSGSNKIRKVVIATGETTTLAGDGTAASVDSSDGTGGTASFNQPLGITTDGTNLYVGDNAGNKIRKVVIATGETTTLAGDGTAASVDSSDGTGGTASFNLPRGITTDGVNLYVADITSVRKVVIATGKTTTLGASLSGGTGGITTDGTNLYVSTAGFILYKIVIATGTTTTIAGSGIASPVSFATGTTADIGFALELVSDGTKLYLPDFVNNVIIVAY